MYDTFGKNWVESAVSESAAMSRKKCCIMHAYSMCTALAFGVQHVCLRGLWFTGFLWQFKIISLMSLLIAKETYLNCFSERIKHIIKHFSDFFLIRWGLLFVFYLSPWMSLYEQTIWFSLLASKDLRIQMESYKKISVVLYYMNKSPKEIFNVLVFSSNILIPLGGIQFGQRLVHMMSGWVILLAGVTALACSTLSLCWQNGVFLTLHIPFSLCC